MIGNGKTEKMYRKIEPSTGDREESMGPWLIVATEEGGLIVTTVVCEEGPAEGTSFGVATSINGLWIVSREGSSPP